MSNTPTFVRSTAGFRFSAVYELTNGLPLGLSVLEPFTPYRVSGSTIISGSTVSVPAGATVSGSVGYYGVVISGGKVMTINDPAPRVIPHIGDDAVYSIQVLPPTEPVSAELHTDKTNDLVDSVVANVKTQTVGEFVIFGQSTNQRGFENQVGMMAYDAAQDTDINSTTFGTQEWDFRIMPKAILFQRDTGYNAEANEHLYTIAPSYVTAHLWGVQFTKAVEGFTTGQLLRGVSQFKPVLMGFLADGTTQAFPFDSARPAATMNKINVWVNGVLQTTGVTKSLVGIVFAVAPTAASIITVFYETST